MLSFTNMLRAALSQMVRVRALFAAFAFLICFAAVQTARAQAITSYVFAPSSGTFTALSGATVQTLAGGSTDDGFYPLAPIGFNFKYNNVVYTQVSASTNGWMRFGSLANGAATNNLTSGGARPLVAPLWDDLAVSPTGGGSVSYLTTGTAPNRVFTMQWLNMRWNFSAAGPVISFQVKLYETTNAVQFVYRQEATAASTPSASIGITATATGSGNFLSLNNSGTAPTASSTVETTTIGTKPATGQIYTFTPPAAPTAASVSIGGRVMTASGRGIRNVYITLTDSNGNTRMAVSSSFGYYRFADVAAGETYIISARGKRYTFIQPTQLLNINEDTDGINFIANPNYTVSDGRK